MIDLAVQNFDVAVSLLVQSFSSPFLTFLMEGVTLLGHPVPWILLAAAIYWHGDDIKAFFLMNLILFSGIFVGLLKGAIGRPRPVAEDGIQIMVAEMAESFPSGHSVLIAALAGYASKIISKIYWPVLIVVSLLVGLSRIYLGVHYLTDVIAGLVLGYVIGIANFKFENRFKKDPRLFSMRKAKTGVLIIMGLAIIGLLFLEYVSFFAALLGFYLGFLILREQRIKVKKISEKQILLKIAIGFLGLTGILALTYVPEMPLLGIIGPTKIYGLYFIGGLWISLIWPLVFEAIASKP